MEISELNKIYYELINENKIDEFHKILSENPSHLNNDNFKIGYDIVSADRINFMKLIMDEFGYDPFKYNNIESDVIWCSMEGSVEMLQFFVDRGLDVHQSFGNHRISYGYKLGETITGPDTLLFIACNNRHYDFVKLLLDSGISPNAMNGDCFLAAIHYYKPEVKLLLDSGVDIEYINKAMYYAIKNLQFQNVQLLLQYGCDMKIAMEMLHEDNKQYSNDLPFKKFINLLVENNADLNEILTMVMCGYNIYKR